MTIPKWLRRDQSVPGEGTLSAEAEHILKALEQGKRATMRPMPQPQRIEPVEGSAHPK